MPEQSAARDRGRGSLIVALILALLLVALPMAAQDAATVALDKSADLAAALKSPDSLTRAAAGRVAMVRGDASLVPALREALAAEKNPAAAREEMRAIVLLGSDDDVAFAASQLARFPLSIDGDFGEAIARLGVPRATSLYLRHAAKSRDPVPATDLALWGRSDQLTATAARLLGARDGRGWAAVLATSAEAEVPIGPNVLATALASASSEIVEETIWYLARYYGFDPSKLPETLRQAATAARQGAPVGEAFGREVIRRMLGAEEVDQPQWVEWLRGKAGRRRYSDHLQPHLTSREMAAVDMPVPPPPPLAPWPKHPSLSVTRAPVSLPILLPDGLAAAILSKTGCRDPWIGTARASVDGAGRVQALDVSNIGVWRGCGQALETMLRLSLAEPERITSPRENVLLIAAKPFGPAVCFDEDPVRDFVSPRGAHMSGGEVKPPAVVKHVAPDVLASVRRDMSRGSVVVVAEAVIARSGCVREVRLVKRSEWSSLNSAVLLALSAWTFKPGTLEGVPVDVIFQLTVNFRPQ
jgi:TonB family protein